MCFFGARDGGTFGRHLANTTERSVLGGNADCRYRYCSNLFYLSNFVSYTEPCNMSKLHFATVIISASLSINIIERKRYWRRPVA